MGNIFNSGAQGATGVRTLALALFVSRSAGLLARCKSCADNQEEVVACAAKVHKAYMMERYF